MEENLELGEVSVIYDDYLAKSVKETKIQLTKDIAIIFKLNKTTNNVDMSIKNTSIDDLEYSSKVDKSNLEKMLKAEKDMFRQLT